MVFVRQVGQPRVGSSFHCLAVLNAFAFKFTEVNAEPYLGQFIFLGAGEKVMWNNFF